MSDSGEGTYGDKTKDVKTNDLLPIAPEKPKKKAWGRVVFYGDRYPSVDLIKDKTTFGRKDSCDVVIKHPAISGVHTKITRDKDNVIFVKDQSTNGTHVNGKLLGRGRRKLIGNGANIMLIRPNKTDETKISFTLFLVASNDHMEEGQGPLALYDIRDHIGAGSFATVKICIDRQTGEKYAMKIIDKKKCQPKIRPGDVRNKSLLDEVKIMQTLNHPNVIKVHNAFETDDYLYIVLDLVSGGDLLDKLIKMNGNIPDDWARDIFIQVFHAVSYLHSQGIVHRDLKPENILLTSSDSNQIQLTDFGLSRIVGEGSFMQTICGTPMYIAPEVIKGMSSKSFKGYDSKVDIWSMGVVLYMLLCGEPPFDQRKPRPILDQISSGVYQYPPEKELTLSKAVKDLVSRLMCVDPEKRITLEEIGRHPWITGDYTKGDTLEADLKRLPDTIASLPERTESTESLASAGSGSDGHSDDAVSPTNINIETASKLGPPEPSVTPLASSVTPLAPGRVGGGGGKLEESRPTAKELRSTLPRALSPGTQQEVTSSASTILQGNESEISTTSTASSTISTNSNATRPSTSPSSSFSTRRRRKRSTSGDTSASSSSIVSSASSSALSSSSSSSLSSSSSTSSPPSSPDSPTSSSSSSSSSSSLSSPSSSSAPSSTSSTPTKSSPKGKLPVPRLITARSSSWSPSNNQTKNYISSSSCASSTSNPARVNIFPSSSTASRGELVNDRTGPEDRHEEIYDASAPISLTSAFSPSSVTTPTPDLFSPRDISPSSGNITPASTTTLSGAVVTPTRNRNNLGGAPSSPRTPVVKSSPDTTPPLFGIPGDGAPPLNLDSHSPTGSFVEGSSKIADHISDYVVVDPPTPPRAIVEKRTERVLQRRVVKSSEPGGISRSSKDKPNVVTIYQDGSSSQSDGSFENFVSSQYEGLTRRQRSSNERRPRHRDRNPRDRIKEGRGQQRSLERPFYQDKEHSAPPSSRAVVHYERVEDEDEDEDEDDDDDPESHEDENNKEVDEITSEALKHSALTSASETAIKGKQRVGILTIKGQCDASEKRSVRWDPTTFAEACSSPRESPEFTRKITELRTDEEAEQLPTPRRETKNRLKRLPTPYPISISNPSSTRVSQPPHPSTSTLSLSSSSSSASNREPDVGRSFLLRWFKNSKIVTLLQKAETFLELAKWIGLLFLIWTIFSRYRSQLYIK